ncbi:potassium channel protein [Archaeoglobales archaeon]|nr:MAG: potassium channel protein [Archaeoglobales archaeon]
MPTDVKKPVITTIIFLLLIVLLGTIGFTILEGWSLFDSFYMTVITITTTGYREVYELSFYGRLLAIVLMFFGIGVFFYGINLIMPILVQRRMERWRKVLENVADHYIVCGYGVMGKEIVDELSQIMDKDKIVIIDENIEKVAVARENGYIAFQGDSIEEKTLERARIRHAKALIACMSDSANAFTIMTAKELNPNIYTMAIARTPAGIKNTKRAGADQVLSPYSDTAKKASIILRRHGAAAFFEIISKVGEDFMLEKVTMTNREFEGVNIRDIDLRNRTGATVVAIERKGEIIVPHATLQLEYGDNLYLIGNEEQLRKASEYLSKSES